MSFTSQRIVRLVGYSGSIGHFILSCLNLLLSLVLSVLYFIKECPISRKHAVVVVFVVDRPKNGRQSEEQIKKTRTCDPVRCEPGSAQ